MNTFIKLGLGFIAGISTCAIIEAITKNKKECEDLLFTDNGDISEDFLKEPYQK